MHRFQLEYNPHRSENFVCVFFSLLYFCLKIIPRIYKVIDNYENMLFI